MAPEECLACQAQARAWLAADLAALRKAADSPDQRSTVKRTLLDWQNEEDFAAVRENRTLYSLPEAERRAWRVLWGDVADLLQQVSMEP